VFVSNTYVSLTEGVKLNHTSLLIVAHAAGYPRLRVMPTLLNVLPELAGAGFAPGDSAIAPVHSSFGLAGPT
jgi:hypothetical protein